MNGKWLRVFCDLAARGVGLGWMGVLTLAVTPAPAAATPPNGPGRAVVFVGGLPDYLEVPAGVWFSGDFSVEGWVFVASHRNYARLLDFGVGQHNENIIVALSTGTSGRPLFQVFSGTDAGNVVTAPTALPLNQWSHLACVLSGTTGTIYVNGVVVASGALHRPVNVVRGRCYLGRSNWASDSYCDAVFDEVRIWNVARSAAELQGSMRRQLFGNEPGLMAYYRLDEPFPSLFAGDSAGGNAAFWPGASFIRSIPSTVNPFAPPVNSLPACPGMDGSASLNGTVDGRTSVSPFESYFEWGPTPSLGTEARSGFIVAPGAAPQNYSLLLPNLAPAETYYFRAVAVNAQGPSYGETVAFTMPGPQRRVVANANDDGCGSLRQTIREAAPGDVITFAPSVAGQTISLLGGELLIDKDLTIQGPGRDLMTLDAIDAPNGSRVFQVTRGVVSIHGLTLLRGLVRAPDGEDAGNSFQPGQPGAPARGGAILNYGELTVSDCRFQNNRVVGGAGGDGAPDLTAFAASNGGAGGEAAGGAIYNAHRLVVANCTIEEGFASAGGGGRGGDSTHPANAFAGAGGTGAGGLGGAIYNLGFMVASNCLFYRCQVTGGAGGEGGDASTFEGRIGGRGGRGGQGYGGALFNLSTALVVNCTFNLNDGAGGNGGNGGNGLTGDGRGGDGGDGLGGAIFNRANAQITLVNDTVVSNDAVPGNEGFSPDFNNNGTRGTGVGGGIYGENLAFTLLLNTLVAFNTANTSHHDVFGVILSLGHNFIRIQDTSFGWLASDQTGTLLAPLDPQILPFGNNGGPSPTVMPRRGSPLVDAGDFTVVAAPWNILTDQRGAYRRAGSGVDIGAVEAPYGAHRAVVNTHDSGFGSLRETLAEAQADAGVNGAFVFFAPWVRGRILLTSGELTLANTGLYGPGADVLAISGNHRSRVLRAPPGTASSGVSYLTICDGLVQEDAPVNYGGGILAEAQFSLIGCVLSNNMVVGRHGADGTGLGNGLPGGDAFGGGLHFTRELYIRESVITANWALGGNGGNGRNGVRGGGAYGGGISGTNVAGTPLSIWFIGDSLIQDNTCRGGRGGTARLGLSFTGEGGDGGDGRGGGMHVAAATPVKEPLSLWLDGCTLAGNRAIGGLGGTGRLNASTAGNGASGGSAMGGGAELNLPVRLTHCTLSGNQAQGGDGADGGFVNGVRSEGGGGGTAAGGGILRSPTHLGSMSNCTITANAARAGLWGLTTNDARIYVGTASGGGVWDSGGGPVQMTVSSSLVAGNHAIGFNHEETGVHSDWFGPVLSAGYNLIGVTNAYGWPAALGDQLGSFAAPLDPALGPLQDNGARIPTNRPIQLPTHVLLPGSPARDAGKSVQSTDQRGAPRVYDEPAVPNAPGGDGSDIGAVEDGQLRIVGLRDPLQDPAVLFTTLPARRHFLESQDILAGPWVTGSASFFGDGNVGELTDAGPPALARFYRVRAGVTRTVVVYTNDFESVVGPEWNVAGRVGTTPVSARKFLGEFAGETATLQLANLPPHTQLRVSFDLFILKSWDGNRTDFGPDTFQLDLRGGPTLFAGTFSNYAPVTQSHPGTLTDNYPPKTGAIENNTLGYTHPNIGQADAVYHLAFTFNHTAPTAMLEFIGANLQDIGDESWGLDNVRVEAINVP